MQTANGQFYYDEEHHGKTLRELVEGAHSYLAKACGWGFSRPPNPGTFGFDNMICSIGKALRSMKICKDTLTLRYVAACVHLGWGENYLYWRDHQPWLDPTRAYCKPSKRLGDSRRDKCLMTAYDDLPQDEKDKDLAIARFLLSLVQQDPTQSVPSSAPQSHQRHPLNMGGCLLAP